MSNKILRTGLLGEHLSHSFSPQIHSYLADYEYRLIELAPEELGPFLQKGDFDALNVTIPYKKDVIPYMAALSDTAKRIGAVNTIVKQPDGRLLGYNTDYDGLSDMIDALRTSLSGKKVLVLGSGGASRTAVTVATYRGARAVVVVSRRGEDNYDNLHRHADAEIIINATPVGMYPHNGEAPLSLTAFPRLEAVFDLIYNPARTALLMEAEARGIPCQNGLLMLVSQARRASELFQNCEISRTVSGDIAKKMQFDAENIILIGMPGCGKSTLGKLLAEYLGRPFFDADAELVRAAGKSIPDIFREEGEEGFRLRETETLAALGKKSGCVIATGGGAVTRERNYSLLHQNGKILFLDVFPDELPTAGRPLSQAKTPQVLYRERLPLYRRFADMTVPVCRDIAENMKRIKEALGV